MLLCSFLPFSFLPVLQGQLKRSQNLYPQADTHTLSEEDCKSIIMYQDTTHNTRCKLKSCRLFPLLRLPGGMRHLPQLFQPLAEGYVPVSLKNNYCNLCIVLRCLVPKSELHRKQDENCSRKQNMQLKEHANDAQKKKEAFT